VALQALDHVNISTRDVAGVRAFFVDVLGLQVGWRPPFPFDGAWLYLGDQAVVHVMEASAEPLPSRGSALDHFAFAAQGFEEMRARLEAHGVAQRAVDVPGSEVRQLFVTVGGVTVELNCRG